MPSLRVQPVKAPEALERRFNPSGWEGHKSQMRLEESPCGFRRTLHVLSKSGDRLGNEGRGGTTGVALTCGGAGPA